MAQRVKTSSHGNVDVASPIRVAGSQRYGHQLTKAGRQRSNFCLADKHLCRSADTLNRALSTRDTKGPEGRGRWRSAPPDVGAALRAQAK